MKSSWDLIGLRVEFPAGMKSGHHDFSGWPFLSFVNPDRDSSAIIGNGDTRIHVDNDIDLVAVPGQRFIDAVVDDFIDQMVKPLRPGAPDIHGGTPANGFQSF